MEFKTIQQFINENRKWSDETFGDMTAIAVLQHLKKEVGETIEAIEDELKATGSKVHPFKKRLTKLEFADCYLLLLNAISRHNLSFTDVHETSIEKMEINRNRSWDAPNEKGFCEHIEQNYTDLLPTQKVCFFKLKNGKYLTENGIEITTEMLVKHPHQITDVWSFIIIN